MKFILLILTTLVFLISPLPSQHSLKADNYIILISFDGFRWDYPEREITPNMQKIRERGVSAVGLKPVFPTKTFPNHISIVTGLYPENHGIILNSFSNPFTGDNYSLGNRAAVRSSKWYDGEFIWETAQKQGVICASYFWPGSSIMQEGRHPKYFEVYDHNRPFPARVKGVLDWLQLPIEERPRFITLYFHESDSQGHNHGPESAEVNQAIALQDSMLGLLVDGLEKIQMLDKTNIIITSDHGMISTYNEKVIHIERNILPNAGCRFISDGPIMMIQPPLGRTNEAFTKIKEHEKHFTAYLREEIPSHLNFSQHPFISDIVLVADSEWTLLHNRSSRWLPGKGNHGFSPHLIDMHGIFYAAGPDFCNGLRTGTLQTIDIYPLLCALLDVKPVQNIDGNFERIGYILER
ncbi:MAG: ectonucleotide pyrophosphatase/phosphodiesterase [Calditrichota bacterium]